MMIKDLNYYLNFRYRIELVSESDGGWGAVIPDLPGCLGGGDTIVEALEMLDDAKQGWLTSHLQHGDSIPEPNTSAQ